MLTDLPLSELLGYAPDVAEPADFDEFWSGPSYIDVVNHAKRAQAPALFSVGLADDITPPSTVFAAFNHYAGPKDIAVYEFNGHEGGGTRHLRAQLDFLAAALG